jgi:hypothetical protein
MGETGGSGGVDRKTTSKRILRERTRMTVAAAMRAVLCHRKRWVGSALTRASCLFVAGLRCFNTIILRDQKAEKQPVSKG